MMFYWANYVIKQTSMLCRTIQINPAIWHLQNLSSGLELACECPLLRFWIPAYLHWSSHSFNGKISSTMSRKRWEQIKANLHLVDNDTLNRDDKLAKVWMLIDHLRCEFRKITMLENLCVDEQMVPFKGASSLKQYIPKKPRKWGYKLFILADNEGLVYDFYPYCGAIPAVHRFGVPDLGPSSNSVLHLAASIPDGKNYKLYFDNSFTSVKLVEHLATRKIWACGTIQERCLPRLLFKDYKQLKKTRPWIIWWATN